jgi:hypothetical protein
MARKLGEDVRRRSEEGEQGGLSSKNVSPLSLLPLS